MTVQGETECEIGKWQFNRGKMGLGALESRISLNACHVMDQQQDRQVMDTSTPAQTARVMKMPKGPQAATSIHRKTFKKLAPPLPARPSSSSHPTTKANGTHPTLPIKNLQGRKTKRTDTTKDGWDRDVVFVTRNTPLGALMGRCRSLIMDEGYVCIAFGMS